MASETTELSGLASRYATALFELADEAKSLDAVAEDLRNIQTLLRDSEELRRLVISPLISREDQARAVNAVLDRAGISGLTRKFISVVTAKRRLFALEAMIKAYLAELARRRGEITADVIAAIPLTPAQTNSLTDQLKRLVGSKVTVNLTVDPSLLGGMIVKVGSRMIDSSLRTKLSKLQLAMKGVG